MKHADCIPVKVGIFQEPVGFRGETIQKKFQSVLSKRDLDELYEPLGDNLVEALWDAGVSDKPFKEALKEAAFARDWKSIYDYVESITDWAEFGLQ